MGFTAINDAQKIRISFSDKAIFTIEDDMTVFGVTSMTVFIIMGSHLEKHCIVMWNWNYLIIQWKSQNL